MVVRKAVALGLLMMLALTLGVGWSLESREPAELLLYGFMTAVGAVVGMQFVVVSWYLVLTGSPEGAAARLAWLGDYWGSALGGLLAGVFLPILFGIAATCLVLVTILVITLIIFLVT